MSSPLSGNQRLLNNPVSPGFYGSNEYINSESDSVFSEQQPDLVTQVPNGHRVGPMEPGPRASNTYVEFLGGSVPCPTCRGVGNIPKEQEGELVALIPLKDKRLKPRRTYLYVGIAVFLCLSVGGLLTFFMFPRSVTLKSNRPFLPPQNLSINTVKDSVHFFVTNYVNITNDNYFSVYVKKVVMACLFREKVINTNSTNTDLEVKLRGRSLIKTAAKIKFNVDNDLGYMASLCSMKETWFHHFSMVFQFTITYSYLGHSEQTSLTAFQTVSCGNDTAITTTPSDNTTTSITTIPSITLHDLS